nr:lysis system i-spanin subunit Rz [Achromobacter xylosoxidans]
MARAAGALAGWKGYAVAALVGGVVLGGAAWTAQGWRYGEQLAGLRAARADEVAEGQRQAREILARRHADVAEINERNGRAEWAAYGGMRNAQIQDDGLRADVDAGRQRLHVRAACTAGGRGVPEASAAAGVDHGARAELDPAARSDYFALRAGIRRLTAQLEACQARLR